MEKMTEKLPESNTESSDSDKAFFFPLSIAAKIYETARYRGRSPAPGKQKRPNLETKTTCGRLLQTQN